jgi:hypothetical protein
MLTRENEGFQNLKISKKKKTDKSFGKQKRIETVNNPQSMSMEIQSDAA